MGISKGISLDVSSDFSGEPLPSGSPYGNDLAFEVTTTGASEVITIPTQNVGTFNATIDWGDDSTSTITTFDDPDLAHTYADPGSYDIRISGQFPNLYWNSTGDCTKVTKFYQLGSTGLMRLLNTFAGCTNMVDGGVTNPVADTSGCNYISGVFLECHSLTQVNVSNWDTSSATNMTQTFRGCVGMTTPPDVSNWNTSGVTNMSFMFYYMTSLTEAPDVSGFDTSSATSMAYMFANMPALIGLDFSGFDVSAVNNVVNMAGFAAATTVSTAVYDATLINWASQTVLSGIDVSFGASKYTSGGAAEAARTSLINDDGWTIADGGPA